MYKTMSSWTSNGQYSVEISNNVDNNFTESNKTQSANELNNANHYCQNTKFDHIGNHWTENMAALHQKVQHHQEPNYFRNQWHFNGAANNSYHVNDTTILNVPVGTAGSPQQNQHGLIIPHPHFHYPSTGKSIWSTPFLLNVTK